MVPITPLRLVPIQRYRQVMKGAFLPFTLRPPVFIGIPGEKMKGEG